MRGGWRRRGRSLLGDEPFHLDEALLRRRQLWIELQRGLEILLGARQIMQAATGVGVVEIG